MRWLVSGTLRRAKIYTAWIRESHMYCWYLKRKMLNIQGALCHVLFLVHSQGGDDLCCMKHEITLLGCETI